MNRRQWRAARKHWQVAAKDIENRVYTAIRAVDLPTGGHVPSDTRPCYKCKQLVLIGVKLLPLADRAKAIACKQCVEAMQNRPYEQIIINELNRDTGEEL